MYRLKDHQSEWKAKTQLLFQRCSMCDTYQPLRSEKNYNFPCQLSEGQTLFFFGPFGQYSTALLNNTENALFSYGAVWELTRFVVLMMSATKLFRCFFPFQVCLYFLCRFYLERVLLNYAWVYCDHINGLLIDLSWITVLLGTGWEVYNHHYICCYYSINHSMITNYNRALQQWLLRLGKELWIWGSETLVLF